MYLVNPNITPLTGADLQKLCTIYSHQSICINHYDLTYEKDNGTLLTFICNHTEDSTTWLIVIKFKESCGGQGRHLYFNKALQG